MSDFRVDKVQVNLNTSGTKKTQGKEAETTEETVVKPETSYKAPGEVLNLMAQAALTSGIKPTKSIDTSKYVDEASAERIAKVMKTFDETILSTAATAISEFGLSEGAAMDAAIIGFNRKYLS